MSSGRRDSGAPLRERRAGGIPAESAEASGAKPAVTALFCAALALCAVFPFSRIHTLDFTNFDDPGYVTHNPHVTPGFTVEGLRWALTSFDQSNWHPVTWFSHMLDCSLFGLNPAGHHLTSLFFHVASTLLLFLALTRMTAAPGRSAFVAALFAAHPLHVESVAWIAERKDVLSAFFWMAAMWLYAAYARTGRRLDYLLLVAAFVLGLASKPMAVTLPFALLLLDAWPLRRADFFGQSPLSRNRAILLEKAPLLALSAVSSVVTFAAQRAGGSVASMDVIPLGHRVANALASYAAYLKKTVWPADLAAFYPRPERPDWPSAFASLLLVAGFTFLALRMRRSRPYLTTGWFWFLGTLVPVIGLVQVGDQAMADRYTYIPLIGIFIIAVWGGMDLGTSMRLPPRALAAAGLAALAAAGSLSWRQVGYWKDSASLFKRTIDVAGDNELAFLNYGAALVEQNRLPEAAALYRDLLSRRPDLSDIQANMGMVLSLSGEHDRALAHYRKALSLQPRHADAHNGLGVSLAANGNQAEAINHYREALRIRPDFPEALYNLGKALAARGDLQSALAHFRRALELHPSYAEVIDALPPLLLRHSLAEYRSARPREAIVWLREAVRLRPEWPDALNSLAWILATSKDSTPGDVSQSVELAERAVRLSGGKDPMFLDTLAAARARGGRYAEAVADAELAIRLATDAGNHSLAQDIESRCRLYRAGRPFSEPR
jgi:tetratricopeptide (TPR) repeat protein